MASTNFSRPRRPSEGQAVHRAVNTLSVVSERDEDLPLEPQFSWNVQHHVSRKHNDTELEHDTRTRTPQLSVKDQRYSSTPSSTGSRNVPSPASQLPNSLTRDGYCHPTMPIPNSPQLGLTRRDSGRGSTSSLSHSNLSSRDNNITTATRPPSSSRTDSVSTSSPVVLSRSNSTTRPPLSSRSNSASTTNSSSKQTFMPKSILKVTTVEQTSERSGSTRSGSAAGSNKSSDSSNGSLTVSYDEAGKFVASDYDTSELSEKEIKKLQKKGVNPALALEMKALRKGKSFGNLTGNAYV